MLASDSLVKYQCICCLGDVPKTSCTIRTNHSLFNCLFFLFLLFFLFSFVFLCVSVCVLSPSQSKKKQKEKNRQKKTCPSMILSSCCNRRPSERLSPKRGPGGTGFQYGAKRHALAGTLSRHPALGQFNQETGREAAFVYIFFSFLSPFQNFFFPPLCGVARRSPRSRCASSCEEPDGQTWRNICG